MVFRDYVLLDYTNTPTIKINVYRELYNKCLYFQIQTERLSYEISFDDQHVTLRNIL